MDVCLLWVLFVFRSRSLRRIDHSSRGALLTVARRCVWSRNLENEEAKARYRAMKNTTTMVCNARKTKQNNNVCLGVQIMKPLQVLIASSRLIQIFSSSTLPENKNKFSWMNRRLHVHKSYVISSRLTWCEEVNKCVQYARDGAYMIRGREKKCLPEFDWL